MLFDEDAIKQEIMARARIRVDRQIRRIRLLAAGLAGVGIVWAGVRYARAHDVILNVTPSLPLGLYHLSPPSPLGDLHDGDMVELCPPSPASSPAMRQAIRRHWLMTAPSSPCADHLVPFIKRIAATPGQRVTISMSGISVDGHLLPATAIKARSKAGRAIIHYPLGGYTVRPGHVWVTDNASPWAYDSRYWGPVTTSHMLALARPVLTW